MSSQRCLRYLAAAAALWLAVIPPTSAPAAARELASPALADGWRSDPSYTIDFLGRDGPNGTDHYQATLGWGATFFGIASETMPLVPPEQAMGILTDGYRATFPGRPIEDIQPGDRFDFYVAAGTLVCTRWRQKGSTVEYESLRGDRLLTYTDFRSPIAYRLVRVETPNLAEVMINHEAEPKAYELAQSIFGQGNPGFKPDFMQVERARKAIESRASIVVADLSKRYLDDFREIKESAEAGGTTEEGLEIYRIRAEEEAQPLFRVDDAVGDGTNPAAFPPLMRVYYYKDGTVRTYQRSSETTFLRGRQPKNDTWERVYAEYGRLDPLPTRWELGQPEQDDAARELNNLGITVLRYRPKEPLRGNFITRLLDLIMGMMKRKQG